MIIWTYHFTKFASFTPSSATVTTAGGTTNSGGCLPQWQCTEWSTCSTESLQTRTCTNLKAYCPGIKPAESQPCTSAPAQTTTPETTPTGTGKATPVTTAPTAGITGAFLGALKTPTGIVVTFILVAALTIGLAFPATGYFKKVRAKRKSSK